MTVEWLEKNGFVHPTDKASWVWINPIYPHITIKCVPWELLVDGKTLMFDPTPEQVMECQETFWTGS